MVVIAVYFLGLLACYFQLELSPKWTAFMVVD